jgi:hypothetical protein
MTELASNLWVLRFPLRLLGVEIGRTVTIIRLASGKVIVHSTAPFAAEDLGAIRTAGEIGWLIDVSNFHDSLAKQGRAALPDVPYLAPEGFPKYSGVATDLLSPAPAEWSTDVEVLELAGMPRVREHVMFHRPSGTLIVADLLFNFGRGGSLWTRLFARHVMRLKNFIGMSPFFRLMIRDRQAFCRSMATMMAWDFDRVIVAHGGIIERGGKARLREVLTAAGLEP